MKNVEKYVLVGFFTYMACTGLSIIGDLPSNPDKPFTAWNFLSVMFVLIGPSILAYWAGVKDGKEAAK